MILSHQYASKPKVIPLYFDADVDDTRGEESSIFGSYTGQQQYDQAPKPSYETRTSSGGSVDSGSESEGSSFMSYVIFIIALVFICVFVLV